MLWCSTVCENLYETWCPKTTGNKMYFSLDEKLSAAQSRPCIMQFVVMAVVTQVHSSSHYLELWGLHGSSLSFLPCICNDAVCRVLLEIVPFLYVPLQLIYQFHLLIYSFIIIIYSYSFILEFVMQWVLHIYEKSYRIYRIKINVCFR